MKVSIITVCYNSVETIESTIQSVVKQDYENIEYIIVDGKSTDSTLHIIEKYKTQISKVISEKDNGIYDALNKGVGLASGDLIGILHADDFYASHQIISTVVEAIHDNHVDAVYGDLQYVDRNNPFKITRTWKSGKYYDGIFLKGWMPPHPTFFVKKKCYTDFGMYNTALRLSADYELMLRYLHKNKISVSYIPEVLVKMRVGGESNVSISNRIKANKEDRLAWKLNGLKPYWYTLFLKPLSKITQFLGQ